MSRTPPDRTASRSTARRLGELLGEQFRRRRHPPALRHPQHGAAADRRDLRRGRRGARPPGLGQGAVRPGRAGPLRARRRLARLGGLRRRHRQVEERLGREAVQGNRHRPDGRRAALEADRREGPAVRPAAPVLRAVGVPGRRSTPASGATGHVHLETLEIAGDPQPGQRLARHLRWRARSRTSRSSGSAPHGTPGWSRPSSAPRTASSASDATRRLVERVETPPRLRPEPEHLAPPRDLRAREPLGRPRAASSRHAMREVLGGDGWAGRDVLDLGCGTGFHLPRWAADGAARCPASSRTPTSRGRGPSYDATGERHGARRDGAAGLPLPPRPSTSPRPGGPTSSVRAASRGCASSTG